MSDLRIRANGLEIGLDRGGCGDCTFISHAHADHLEGAKSIKSLIQARRRRCLRA